MSPFSSGVMWVSIYAAELSGLTAVAAFFGCF